MCPSNTTKIMLEQECTQAIQLEIMLEQQCTQAIQLESMFEQQCAQSHNMVQWHALI